MNSAEALGYLTVLSLGMGVPIYFDLGVLGIIAGVIFIIIVGGIFESEKKKAKQRERLP